ncbi:HAD family phosphatase [Williamsia sp. 1135]|uniref:HAD family hydrolase n=1 Tax=Williamsia sp. 1135 TaxID=1889262 RepID=UPI00197DDF06|nr:HAD family phosphatase [Williamsia sp. 1135]
MIEALVFDMDGVLVDSEPIWEEVRRGVVAEYGGTWLPEAQTALMGMSTPEWAAYLSADLGVGKAPAEVATIVIDHMVARYEEHLPVLPGADEAVRRCAARWPLGLASSSPRRLIDAVLETAGWTDLFEVTVSTEELDRGKPAPDVYLHAVRELGREPAACAAIEDSSNGMRSATAAGLILIAAPRPDYPPADDALAKAALVIDGIDALTTDAVESLGTDQASTR